MLVLVGTHFVPTGTYFCIFIEHKIEWIFKINELKIERWKKLNFARKIRKRDYHIVKIKQQKNSMTLVERILKEMYFWGNIKYLTSQLYVHRSTFSCNFIILSCEGVRSEIWEIRSYRKKGIELFIWQREGVSKTITKTLFQVRSNCSGPRINIQKPTK